MRLRGIHFLLSYSCTTECDHCFVWSGPGAGGTMTLGQIRDVLHQAQALGTVKMVYFEGGEPFLYYPIMVQGLRESANMGFRRGIVSNAYWATSVEDAVEWLTPLAEIGLHDLSLSSDLFHGESMMTRDARNGIEAARQLDLPESTIHIETPEGCGPRNAEVKGEPVTGGPVRFRGRAVVKLTNGLPRRPWSDFTQCPDEDFYDPGRVHVDAYGHVHICQGVLIGNLWQQPLTDLVAAYEPAQHPIIGPLAEGGPAALVRTYALAHKEGYVDACHLCYRAREALRPRFPKLLAPATVYGEREESEP